MVHLENIEAIETRLWRASDVRALLVLHCRRRQPSVKTIVAPHSAAVKRPDCRRPADADAGERSHCMRQKRSNIAKMQ
jgi:hypothetical protein